MKKMIVWILTVLPLVAFSQMSSDTSGWPQLLQKEQMKESGTYKKLHRFVHYVGKAMKRTGSDAIITIYPVDIRLPISDGDAWSMKLKGSDNFHGICITEELLMRSSNLWLKNIAQHEVCHIALGHTSHTSLADKEIEAIYELEATTCTQKYLGEKKTIPFIAEYLFLPELKDRELALKKSRKYAEILAQLY